MTNEERRIHARIALDHPCDLEVGQGDARGGTLRQLSKGGAQLHLAGEAPVEVGEPVMLCPEPLEGTEPVSLPGSVVHLEHGEETVRVGVAFGALDGAQQRTLQDFLRKATVSSPSGGGPRRHPRISRRVEVRCETAAETRAVMCDLSQGGIGLESPEPMSVGESVRVTVALPGFDSTLQLEGTVVHTRVLESGRHHTGLRFEELAPERSGVLRDLMQFLVSEPGGE